jgi:16S rRNA (guanine527-N7)-methyltransferase
VSAAKAQHPAQPVALTAPDAARAAFGDRLPLAQRYAALLAGTGIERGLLGPREADRIWERHLLNSAVVADLLPTHGRVVDVGSGAGLPGLPIALRRSGLQVDLVEPLQRRALFLDEVVAELGLGQRVRVLRGRAEDASVRATASNADWVVARAVAPLDRLVRWCFPLLSPGGRLLALKGSSATDEVSRHEAQLRRMRAAEWHVVQMDVDWLGSPTWVVVVQRGTA